MSEQDESTPRTTAHPTPAGTMQSAHPAGTSDPASAPDGARTGTIVTGLVLVLLGLGVTAIGAGASLDLQAALIVLLAVAGTALLVGAALSALRRGRR